MAAENAASVKVAERLGMICEESIEKELHGAVYEGRRYGLTKSRFFEIRNLSGPKLKRN